MVMDIEFMRAREKLEKEQRESKHRAKLKLERDRKIKQETLPWRKAMTASRRQRRLFAAEAESKANQLAETGSGIIFSRILEAVPYQRVGDKIRLPTSCFTELSEQGAFDKGPLHFSLSLIHQEATMQAESADKDSPRTTHAGVLEFTGEEGFVALPQHCWSNLFPKEWPSSASVEVCYVCLPKGTHAKLQSVEYGFSDIPNHMAILKMSLRQHAALSQGDILTVNHGALTYHLRVLELKPSSSISVLETDIEVDIIGPETVDSTNYMLRPLTIGKPEVGVVEEGKYVYYNFSFDDDTWKRIASKDANTMVNLELETRDGDTELYVSKHPLLFPTQHQHMWSSHDSGSNVVLVRAEDQSLVTGTYTVAVYGYKGTSNY